MARTISDQDLQSIIVRGDGRILVEQAQAFGQELAKDQLTTSQLRNAFGTMRQINFSWESRGSQASLRKALLLKPRLAYQAQRDQKMKPLAQVISGAIDYVAESHDSEEQRRRFGYLMDLFEAIVAYHTAAGGR